MLKKETRYLEVEDQPLHPKNKDRGPLKGKDEETTRYILIGRKGTSVPLRLKTLSPHITTTRKEVDE